MVCRRDRDTPERIRPAGNTIGVDAALKALTYDHHRPMYGTLNIYQWVLIVAFHNLRHNEQVAAVVAAPGFPPA